MKNKIAFLSEAGNFTFQNVVLNELQNDYVRTRNLYCGICGSDYSYYIGRRNNYPQTLGHEGIAIIEDSKSQFFKKDDYVITDFNYRCLDCEYCKNNLSHLCDKNDISLFSNRMFALYSDIHYSYLTKIPKPKNIIAGSLIEPLSCCIHALEKYSLDTNSSILIYGAGSIGTLMAFYLISYKKCNCIDAYDIIKEKTINLCNYFRVGTYSSKKKYDIIIEATNSLDGFINLLRDCPKNQTICSMSHLYGENTSKIYEYILQKELRVSFPLRNGNQDNMIFAAHIIYDLWDSRFNSMISIDSLENINDAFRQKKFSTYNKQVISID
ncbi:MAG: alcohol dehydrogenase catalytic domain-containing protein [Bacilli bacterium]|nr:alcohol dehydrogenase catalytic domain-containing protein [Bacilli bacterium]